jgi:LmbE family N-acetylglucosaminyl deacetylase
MASGKRPVVFVTAHPDDLAHAMGGTAVLLSRRYQVHVLCLTRGERGIRGKSMAQAAAIRSREEQAAAALLGARVTFLGQVDGEIFADRAICAKVARILKALRPKALFTLWPLNVPDHFMCYTIAIKALHLAGIFYTTEVYMGENGIGGQTNQFDPDLYVDITTVVEAKREMVRCHRSQNPGEASVERVLERNRLRGMMARCDFAEPFKSVMALANRRWGRRAGSLLLGL